MSEEKPVVEITDDEEDGGEDHPNLFVTPEDMKNGDFKTIDDAEEELENY